MHWTTIITTLAGVLFGAGGGLLYFRPKLAELKAEAHRKQTEANVARNNALIQRLDSLEQLYTKQGEQLDDMRSQVLELKQQIALKDEIIAGLEAENKKLASRVKKLEAIARTK